MKNKLDQIVIVISTLFVIVVMTLAIYFFQIKVEDYKATFLHAVNEEIKNINELLKKELTIKNVVQGINQTSYIYVEPNQNRVRIVTDEEIVINNDINSVVSELFDYLNIVKSGVNFELLYKEFDKLTQKESFTKINKINLNNEADLYSFSFNNVNVTDFYDNLDKTLIVKKRPFKLELTLENKIFKSIRLLLEEKEINLTKINEYENKIIIKEDQKVTTIHQFIS